MRKICLVLSLVLLLSACASVAPMNDASESTSHDPEKTTESTAGSSEEVPAEPSSEEVPTESSAAPVSESEVNPAYLPYADQNHPNALAVLVNEPFDGTEPAATVLLEIDGEYDRLYMIPRYVGSTVSIAEIRYDEDGAELPPLPVQTLSAESDCVIYGALFRPEGMPQWAVEITTPEGDSAALTLAYHGDTGTPRLEYIEP